MKDVFCEEHRVFRWCTSCILDQSCPEKLTIIIFCLCNNSKTADYVRVKGWRWWQFLFPCYRDKALITDVAEENTQHLLTDLVLKKKNTTDIELSNAQNILFQSVHCKRRVVNTVWCIVLELRSSDYGNSLNWKYKRIRFNSFNNDFTFLEIEFFWKLKNSQIHQIVYRLKQENGFVQQIMTPNVIRNHMQLLLSSLQRLLIIYDIFWFQFLKAQQDSFWTHF